MNIQIFGKGKCFDTKKAERWFKERRIKYQLIDVVRFGMSRGELNSVCQALGLDALIDPAAPGAESISYLAYADDKFEKLLENQGLLKTPVVRNGKQAASGYCPEVWGNWT